MRSPLVLAAAAMVAVLSAPAIGAQAPAQTGQPAAAPEPPYAPTVSLVLAAPLVLDATVRSASQIRGAEAANVPPGHARFYVQADVGALIRGAGALSSRVGYVVDLPFDANGRPPRLRRQRVLLFARPVAGSADQLQLVSGNAQQSWTAAADVLVRQVVREVLAPDAPPAITGIGNAFFVPGALPGEGETQVFVQTASGAPVSLQVLRRPGEQPRWGVALADIIGDVSPPQKNTLLWYRLACGLPATLPDTALRDADPATTEQARADYRFVIADLGPCR